MATPHNSIDFTVNTTFGEYACNVSAVAEGLQPAYLCKVQRLGCEAGKVYAIYSGQIVLHMGEHGLYMKTHPKAPPISPAWHELVGIISGHILANI